MTTHRIKIQIIPTRLGCWAVFANGARVIRSTREPLTEIAQRLLAAGHKPTARIWMTKTPDGPCQAVSTIADAATAAVLPRRHPFRAPEWRNLNSNGAH